MNAPLRQERGIEVHDTTVGRLVRKKGWRYKKTVVASERDREDILEAREAWEEGQTSCDASALVFLDETSATTDMTRRDERAKGASRCLEDAPSGHWKTMTFIAGLRVDGLTAPWCLDSVMGGCAFVS